MADNITLTVRVRDLTQGDFARLNQRLTRMRQNLNHIGQGGRTASVAATRLGRDIDSLGNAMLRMRNNGTLTRTELDRMRTTLRGMSRDAMSTYRSGEINRAQFRAITRDIRGMRREFDGLGRDRQGFMRLVGAIGDVGKMFLNSGRAAKIFMLVLALIGPIAQALGVLLVTALGGAFIALGAFALRGNQQVKTAFQDMKTTVGSTVRDAAAPLKGPLVNAINSVGAAFRAMKPQLTEAFSGAAPLVGDFVGAFTDLVQSALPGMTTALKNSIPAMQGFRTAMGDIGSGIGEMFAAITRGNAENLKRVWLDLGAGLRDVLNSMGVFIGDMVESEMIAAELRGTLALLSGAFTVLGWAIKGLDIVYGGFKEATQGIRAGLHALLGTSDGVNRSLK